MNCPIIPQISAKEFYDKLPEPVRKQRIPWSGTMELTARCNLKCVHCYINKSVHDRQALKMELGTEELLRIIDEVAAEGCLSLLMTGGEPLVRNDFLRVYAHAKQQGLILKLFTNGTLITPAIADYLAEWPPHSVEITLYGRSERVYEQVTGVHGSYARCLRGIELLIDRGIHVILKTVVLETNKHELWEMKDFARGLGLPFRFDAALNHRLDGDATPGTFRIDPGEIVQLDELDGDRAKAWKAYSDHFCGSWPRNGALYQCGAGKTSFHIDADGFLSVCIMSRTPGFDLRCGGFHSGWSEFIPEVIQQTRRASTRCRDCDLAYLCDQCPGWAQLEHGDPEIPVEFLCRIAHARAKSLGIITSEQGESTHVA